MQAFSYQLSALSQVLKSSILCLKVLLYAW
jgi:hypothetical protein